MAIKKLAGIRRLCSKGHIYYKSGDCPVCPTCEKKKNTEGFLATVAAPARRALQNAGVNTVVHLSKKTEAEVLKLHGVGPGTIPKLRTALKSQGLAFKT